MIFYEKEINLHEFCTQYVILLLFLLRPRGKQSEKKAESFGKIEVWPTKIKV